MGTWSIFTFYLAIIVNVLVALVYPFDKDTGILGTNIHFYWVFAEKGIIVR